MLKFASRWKMAAGLLAAIVLSVTLARCGAAFPDEDSDQQSSGFGQTDSADDSGVHYHFHYHYHSPYLSHDDDSGTPGYGAAGSQKFAPNDVAGANRYYTPGYIKSSRTPSPTRSYVGDRDDEDGRTEIMDRPGADDADDNDEVGENVDQASSDGDASINASIGAAIGPKGNQSFRSRQAVSSPAPGARALPGDRGYLRVIVPMPDTKLIYDGHEVAGFGLLRSVMTARIAAGGGLTYTLVACWKDLSGNPRVSVHEAAIEAGEHQTVEFNVAAPERQ